MEYRQLPRGGENEKFSALGLGMGGIQQSSDGEIERTIRLAIENGINFFDLCAGAKKVYQPFGRAIAGKREDVFIHNCVSGRFTTKTASTAGQESLKA